MADIGHFLLLLLLVATTTASPRREPFFANYGSDVTWEGNVKNYPETDAERLLGDLKSQNKLKYFISREHINEVTQKIAGNTNYNNLCVTTKRRFFPRRVDIDGTKYFVLNPTSRLIQYIDVEICNSTRRDARSEEPQKGYEGQACLLVDDAGAGYSTTCVQEYITRVVYLMSNDVPRRLLKYSVKVESCCSCLIDSDW